MFKINNTRYNLIVATEDKMLEAIKLSDIPINIKIKLLPVISDDFMNHLYSKVNLSIKLLNTSIRTPDSFIAYDKEDITQFEMKIQKPYLLKKDSSGGGAGIYLVGEEQRVSELINNMNFPIVVQKKIVGKLLDLSGFYQNGELIYFHCSEMLICRPNDFGLSIVRRYYKSDRIGEGYHRDLAALGKLLGIHGFTNVSAIRASLDGNLYIFEADIRPNAWVEHGLFIDEDPAVELQQYFLNGVISKKDYILEDEYILDDTGSLVIPVYSRMTEKEIEDNAYNCNQFIRNYLK
jgi:hypothetical protein